jgi:hypothetical protein
MSSSVSSFRRIAVGLGLAQAALCLMLLAIVWIVFAERYNRVDVVHGIVVRRGASVRLVVGVAAGMVLASSVLDIIARILCLAVPAELGRIRYIIFVCVTCSLVAVVISGLQLGRLFLGLPKLPTAVDLAGTSNEAASSILFLVFLRSLALFLNRRDLATRAMTLGIVTVLLLIFMVPLFAAAQIIKNELGLGLDTILGMVNMVMGVVLVVRYSNLLTNLRKAVMVHASQVSARPPAEVLPRGATDDQGYFPA